MRGRTQLQPMRGAMCTVALCVGIVGSAVCVSGSARADDVVITEEARTHFAAGVALLKDPRAPRYEDAYREFKAAYAAAPSYKILGNLGLCAMQIERDKEAINAYESYLKLAGPELTAEELEQIKRDLLTLRSGVVEVTVSSDPPGASIIDVRIPVQGSEIRNSYGQNLAPLPLGLRRGHHVISAKLEGYQDQQWEFDTVGDKLPPHVFAMQKPVAPPPVRVEAAPQPLMVRERPMTGAAYASIAATGGLLAVGSFFGALALQKHSDFTTVNPPAGSNPTQAASDKRTGQVLNGVTDASFGAAIVMAGVASYFIFTRPTVERPASYGLVDGLRRHLSVAPTWSARGPGAAAILSF
jgi:hypothetical protein